MDLHLSRFPKFFIRNWFKPHFSIIWPSNFMQKKKNSKKVKLPFLGLNLLRLPWFWVNEIFGLCQFICIMAPYNHTKFQKNLMSRSWDFFRMDRRGWIHRTSHSRMDDQRQEMLDDRSETFHPGDQPETNFTRVFFPL